MKILKIDKDSGLFYDGKQFKNISSISKNDVLNMMNIIYESNESIEFDEETKEKPIKNKAEQIIYSRIREYLISFLKDKDGVKDEIEKNLIRELESKPN